MNYHEATTLAEKFAEELVKRTLSEYASSTVRLRIESLILVAARAHGEAMGKAMAEAKKGER